MLTFRDTGKIIEVKGNFLKMITNINYIVDLASFSDKKLMYDFAKESNSDVKAQGNKSTRDRILIKILKAPGLIVSASGVSKATFLSSDPDELYNTFKLFLQEKHARKNSNIFNDEIVVIIDKLLENKCIPEKQHIQNLIKCNLLHEQL